ncbi:LemA family protein [Rhodococcus ruber]|nr:LemA family protein [Rhodococcus ruber]MBP2213036.1 LemA protein [Rhodococcus ruber]MCZ4503957.1 LemA family protein [Rhodococcus ruber]MCZ4621753.1 LemA family protein [Rhodococcus ruber]MDI9967482.1 LemA family protein [Rhodococcus ruber]MDI9988697.1 LemA family protein [Rhodococcus ruber]
MALVIVVAVVVIVLLWTRAAVRRLRVLKMRHRDSLRLLTNELDDRYDQVPALIAASAGAGLDRSRLSPVVGARSLAIAMRDQRLPLGERAAAENTLSAALHELIGVLDGVNHWPFIRVARELRTREQRIAGAARVHNDLGRTINTAATTFPTSVFARIAAVGPVPLFEVVAPLAPAPLAPAAVVPPVPVAPEPAAASADAPTGGSDTVAA